MAAASSDVEPIVIGRYAIFEEVARGGMAAVHAGRLCGPGGFSKTVAVKRLHPAYASDPEFVAMFLDEARLAARIQHPNVVSVIDVVATKGELFMVMEYVHGESLSNLLRASRAARRPVPPEIAVHIATNLLFGLHAAHEARAADTGEALGIVHRDVSPQNVLVGMDGIARVLDFGVAKAAQRMRETRDGSVKGKIAYMSPEQLSGKDVDRRTDIWAASVVLWEALSGRRMFDFEELGKTIASVLGGNFDPPSAHAGTLPAGLDEIVLKGLAIDAEARWATAEEMALALESVCPAVAPRTVARWVESIADEKLRLKADIISRTAQRAIPALAAGSAAAASEVPSSSSSPLPARNGTQPQIASSDEATLAESAALPRRAASAPEVVTGPSRRRAAAILGVSMALAVVGLVLIVRTLIARTAAAAASEPRSAATSVEPPVATPVATDVATPVATEVATEEPTTAPPSSDTTSPPPSTKDDLPTEPEASAPIAKGAPKPRANAPAVRSAPTPPPPPGTPQATPSPSPPPPPPPPTVTAPAAPPPEPVRPRYVLASARVEVGGATNAIGTTPSSVNRIVAPLSPRITECYRSALPRMRDPLEGAGNIHLETDEDGVIARVGVSGAAAGASSCIASLLSGRKIPNVDTGRARADVPLVLRAQ